MATVSLQTVFDDARRAIETGAADKAIGIAQHILVHFPRMIEGSRLLGEAYLNAGQPEQAAAAFSQVLDADPENVAAYYGRGLALQSMEQSPAAITSFERALEIQPNLADLRTQLMRLYSETPGSAGQFRLSRAGLGRLYARGGMFSQAIDEFRAVLDAEPARDDVKVALAEALWRDGQEDEAMDYCRDLLEAQPELLKPTVLLGYILFAAGQPEGETLWRRAAAQDATMALPRTLFDILPPIRIEEPVIPEFDEAEWRAQEARRAGQAQAAVVAPAANEAEEDFFADSWLSSAGSAGASASTAQIYDAQPRGAPATVQAVGGGDDDDLLASLLGFDVDEPAAEPAAATADVTDVQPFSFDDWDAPSGGNHQAQSEALPPSLNGLGLQDDQAGAEANADIGAVKPFSLDDWSFDDEPEQSTNVTGRATSKLDDDLDLRNIDAFSLDEPESASAPTPTNASDLGNVQPFSLDFDAESEPSGGLRPFSLEDDEPTSGVRPFSLEDDEPTGGVQPFSLEDDGDLGSSVKPFSFDDEDLGVAPFSFEDETGDAPAPRAATNAEEGLGAVQPFSLDEWDLESADEPMSSQSSTNASRAVSDDEHMEGLGDFKPFSLDELALDSLDDDSSGALSGPRLADIEEVTPEPASFNWEEPTWRAAVTPGTEGEAPADESIFSKLMRNRPSAEQGDVEALAPADVSSEEEQHFFSLDDESLRLDLDGIDQHASTSEFDDLVSHMGDAGTAPQAELPVEAGAEAAVQGDRGAVDDAALPFSLDELTASDESFSWETAQPTGQAGAEEDVLPFSLDELTSSDEGLPRETAQPTGQAGTEEMVPFSLSELGFSDDELAALDAQPELTAGTTPGDESVLAPFSLAELGLSDDELAALDLDADADAADDAALLALESDAQLQDEASAAEPDTQPIEVTAIDEGEMLPFSMGDLGLTDDELALLNDEAAGNEATGEVAEAGREDYGSMLSGLDESEQPLLSAADNGGDDADQTEWLELQAELDVDLPATRTADDFLMEAKVTDGDVQSVLETMPTDNVGDDPAEALPFSLADLGLSDEELALFDQSSSDQNVGNQSYPVPDDAAPESPFADVSALDGLFATEEPDSSFEQVDSSPAFTADADAETALDDPGVVGPVPLDPASSAASDDESVLAPDAPSSEPSSFEAEWDGLSYDVVEQPAAEVEGGEPEGALPAELPEGAQPLAAVAEAPSAVEAAAAPQAAAQMDGDYADGIAAIHAQLAADPENDAMRLAVARMSQSMNDAGQAVEQYRLLIKRGRLLDEVVVDLQDTIAENDDPQMLRRLHRLLGDAYMKQNRIREAMDEYSWTLPRSS